MVIKIARIRNDPVIVYATEELKRCMKIMDPSLDILMLTYPHWREDVKDALWVGEDPALCLRLPAVADRTLDDAIAIEVTKGVGYITGANPRAVLIGVFRYLRELGAAWVRPLDGEWLPRCDVCSHDVRVIEKPACRHRGVCIEGTVSAEHVLNMIDWLPRVGMNSYFNQFLVPATFYERWYQGAVEKQAYSVDRADIEGLRDTSVYEIKKRGLLYHATGHGWTCEPFGIEGMGWDADREYTIPEETKQYLALTDGERKLWNNIPLNTNLCYSNPEVRKIISDAIVSYCRAVPEVDYLHVWLADDGNNHCECEACKQKRPADWYIVLLNAIDAAMSENNLHTKIVFLIYQDLFWPPIEEQLNNPGRFVLMFAPITRTYSKSLGEAGAFDGTKLPDYVRNQCKMPSSVEENLCWLKMWQKGFSGDSFLFDYHYMWDHHSDIAHMSMNRVLFEDMVALQKLGLNGMVSCQNQRVWMPSGFGMYAMAQALWDDRKDYSKTADRYFCDAFGPEGLQVKEYLQNLSELLMPAYWRNEMEKINPIVADNMSKAMDYIAAFKTTVQKNMQTNFPKAQHVSWIYLDAHGDYCGLLAAAVQKRAQGKPQEAEQGLAAVQEYLLRNWETMKDALDVSLLTYVISKRLA